MRIGVFEDKFYAQQWRESLRARGAVAVELDPQTLDLEHLRSLDGVMWRWRLGYPDRFLAPSVLGLIESQVGLPVYPSSAMRWAWEDKIRQAMLAQLHGLKYPETQIHFNYGSALEWADRVDYPWVFKLAGGAGSSGVTLVENKKEARNLIRRTFVNGLAAKDDLAVVKRHPRLSLFVDFVDGQRKKKLTVESRRVVQKGFAYFQRFIEGNQYDIRVTVIGDRAIVYRRLNRKDDFRASGSGMRTYDLEGLNIDIVKYAFEVNRRLGFHCMAYDFLQTADDFVFVEFCWTFVATYVDSAPGYFTQDGVFHLAPTQAADLQVEWFLNQIAASRK